MLIRLFTIFLFLFVYFGGFTLPVLAQSNDDFFKVCWTESDCYKDPQASDKDKNTGSKYEFVPGKYLPDGDVCKVKGKENEIGRCYYKPRLIDLQVKIPLIGNVKDVLSDKYFNDNKVRTDKQSGEVSSVAGFPAYIALMYAYFTSIAGIVAVTVMAYGGYQWLVAGGNAEKISQAKSTIQGAVAGLVLVLGSYVILDQINSKLVTMKDLRVDRIKPVFLAQTCNELEEFGVDDLVTEKDKDGDGVSPDNAKCGVKYFSKSNPAQQCMGASCSQYGDKKPYCIPDDTSKNWKCASKEDLFDVCKSKSKSEECAEVDEKFFAPLYPQFVCSYGITGRTSMGCKISNLYVEPSGFQRINCREGAPVCFDNDSNIYKGFCKDLKIKRVGNDGWSSICVQQKECITTKPSGEVDCKSFGLKDGCEYVKYGSCWRLVGFSNLIKVK